MLKHKKLIQTTTLLQPNMIPLYLSEQCAQIVLFNTQLTILSTTQGFVHTSKHTEQHVLKDKYTNTMSSNNKHKSDKPNTPKKFENRARQAATIASYADNQEPSNKKSISEEARQKVARIYDVFDGKWKKEDILRSLEEHDLDEQATIWAKTEGKDEWKDVPSKRRVEVCSCAKKITNILATKEIQKAQYGR